MAVLKKILGSLLFLTVSLPCFCWGFYAHKRINHLAVFLLPPEMLVFYKPHIDFIGGHAVDPDKRRYLLPVEAARHYIDLDRYGSTPFSDLPHQWTAAVKQYGADSLNAHGIVPWWIVKVLQQLTKAFKEKNQTAILKLSADIGHYIADAHVPLHASSNHNGQFTDQIGIHGFWESRLPELLADKEWDFFIGKAAYIANPSEYIWKRVLESAAAADTVLKIEKQLAAGFGAGLRYAFEDRNGVTIRQFSTSYSLAYNKALNGMVERRMRASIYAVASFWYTAWVNAGQPDLKMLSNKQFSEKEISEFEALNRIWKTKVAEGQEHD